MVYRKGPWTSFYGYINYPKCCYKEEYIPNEYKNNSL